MSNLDMKRSTILYACTGLYYLYPISDIWRAEYESTIFFKICWPGAQGENGIIFRFKVRLKIIENVIIPYIAKKYDKMYFISSQTFRWRVLELNTFDIHFWPISFCTKNWM